MNKRFYFIVNPVSGSGRAETMFVETQALLDAAGVDYAYRYTEYPGHAIELAREALAAGEQCIVSVGGDGTAQEIASTLLHTQAVMGLLPYGTGNDFAKSIGLIPDVKNSFDVLMRYNVRKVDAACANGEVFINVAGFGFDVDVVKYTEKYKKRYNGMLPYMLGIFQSLLHLHPLDVEYVCDGETKTASVLLFGVCNGTHFAGGINVAPEASVHDGLLDVCLVKKMNKLQFLCLLPRYIKGRHLNSPHIDYFKASSVSVITPGCGTLNLDGELRSSTPVDFKIDRDALNVITATDG